MAELASKKPKNCRFELRLKSKVTGGDESQRRNVEKGEESAPRLQEPKEMTRQESILAHMHRLEAKNKELQRQLDSIQLQLMGHQDLKKQLSSLQDTHTTLSDKYKEEHTANKKVVQDLQLRLDEAALAKRKAEEQLLLTGSTPAADARKSQGLLEEIQEKYSEEVANLTSEIRVKDKTLQEMRTKRIYLVGSYRD